MMKLRRRFEILFPANPPNGSRWIVKFLAGVAAVVFLTGGAHAQSSVEKIETSQQATQPVDSAGRASDAVLKPEAKPQSSEPGQYAGAYAFSSSIELGYRFVAERGSRDRFRSDLNLRDGLRLLDYQFDARSINGRGALFDYLRGDVSNAGGDGNQ